MTAGDPRMIRVLLVDGSAFVRQQFRRILAAADDITVIGEAGDGAEGLRLFAELKPDVVTLDVEMPVLDGFGLLRALPAADRYRVIMVSNVSENAISASLTAFELGASDFIRKSPPEQLQQRLPERIRQVSQFRPIPPRAAAAPAPRYAPCTRVVAIGISTGGPNALAVLLPRLPGDFPAAILIVQHIAPGFSRTLAERLDGSCALQVKEAAAGDRVLHGRVLIAPGDRHLTINRSGDVATVQLDQTPPVNGHRPSADVLLRSVAATFGAESIGVVMTGMGNDGAAGLKALREAGGRTAAQDEASSLIFGMPKAAIAADAAQQVVSLDDLPGFLQQAVRRQ